MTSGYRAIREGAAILRLRGRGNIRVTGEDRVRLLHAMTTNHIQQISAGHGCYALLLNAQGRMLADLHVLVMPEFILLDTEPDAFETVYAHLDRYIIADDVTLENQSAQTAAIGVEGPNSRDVLHALNAPIPEALHDTLEWEKALVSKMTATGAEGYRIFAPVDDETAFIEQLRKAGAVDADDEDARTARIENGRPRFRDDFSDRYLPNEAQLFSALHFNKGCYLGQEIVERVRSRGQVHRLLVPLRIVGDQLPASGSELTMDGGKVGEITSAAYSPALGMVAALGYVRDGYAEPGKQLQCGDRTVTVTAERPS